MEYQQTQLLAQLHPGAQQATLFLTHKHIMNIDERASNAPPIFTRGLCRGCSLLQQYKQLATPAAAQAIQTAVAFLGHFCRAA